MTDEKDENIKTNAASLEGVFLVGKTLKEVRPLNDYELSLYGWDEIPQGQDAVAFVFDDGTILIPTSFDGVMPALFDYQREMDPDFLTNQNA